MIQKKWWMNIETKIGKRDRVGDGGKRGCIITILFYVVNRI